MIPRVSFSRKGEMMKKIIMVVAMILCLGITVHASAMPVTLPYVPPMEVQVYDALFNASGVTAIEESDEQKRLNAYIDLFTKAMGLTAESFLEDMRNVVENAKTTKQITLDSDNATLLQQAVKYAMETGYDVSVGTEIEYTRTDVINKINLHAHELYNSGNMSTQSINGIVDYLYQGGSLMFHVSGTYHCVSAGDFSNVTNNSFYAIYTRTNIWRNGYWQWTNFFNTQFNVDYVEFYPTLDDFMQAGAKKKVVAKDTATQQAISAGKNAILTADSTLTESDLLDTTKPVVINIYRNITYPATTQEDIEEKQRELVVTNIATDEVAITQKETLEDIRTETYGDTETYKLDLLSFFPFCIPKDIMLLLQAFVAEPQTPEFDIPFPTWENGQMTTMNYTLSLAQFESLAAALRLFEIVVFTIGLLVVTRQKYLRG